VFLHARASEFVELFTQSARMRQTTDGQIDCATEKCVAIGGIACAGISDSA